MSFLAIYLLSSAFAAPFDGGPSSNTPLATWTHTGMVTI
jgi:hypothetical protein